MPTARRLLTGTLFTLLVAAVPSAALAQCDQLVVRYDGSNWWWGAFGNCKRPGGPTERNAVFECAWAQVPANDRTACLKARLQTTDQTRRGIDAVIAANDPTGCGQLVVHYDGSNWWWGAFGNCMRPGGPIDRTAIFECAWSQVPAADKRQCLKDRLLASDQTRRGTDQVIAFNDPTGCGRLVVHYDGSNWWWGAFGNCKRPGGPTGRNEIFECAWNQVPAADRKQCLKDRLLLSDQTRRGIDEVAAVNGALPNNISTARFNSCADPRTGCPETCDLPTDGSVPAGYFEPAAPPALLDLPHEGRLRADLRAVARVADPLGCSLHLAAIEHARGNLDTARAEADLSVTGRKAFAAFARDRPQDAYCQGLAARPLAAGCPPAPVRGLSADAIVRGCGWALDRAYQVANFLRTGQSLQTNPGKVAERAGLGWIAVSGEDDQPRRPVNVPSSDFPQYEMDVLVETPGALPPAPPMITVPTRYVVAQSRPPAAAPLAANAGRTLRPESQWPAIGPDAEIVVFVHGMDSRAEEATDFIGALFRKKGNSPGNLVVIAVDLPTSGYAENLDFDRVSPLAAIGAPKLTPLPIPVPIPVELMSVVVPAFVGAGLPPPPGVIPPGFPIPDFGASGQVPLLDFIEAFVVRFIDTLDRQVPVKGNIKAVVGGSLGGNISFRLGRRPGIPWLPAVVVWSPASIWTSLGEGADILKHLGPRTAWERAADRNPADPGDLAPGRAGRRQAFFGSWDVPTIPGVIPAQSDTWTSDYWPCKRSAVKGARLDRHETYDARFLSWHWRLAAEQLLYSHLSPDPATHAPRFLSNNKRMLLACGTEDRVPFNDICPATQKTAPFMVATPGRAIFLESTGHSLDNERRDFWAQQVTDFLGL